MTEITRRNLLIGGAAAAATGILGGAGAFAGTANAAGSALALPPPSRTEIRRWATDTWASLVAMTDERTGLTADNIDGPLANPNRSGYTSPTNIGGYLWSAIVARDLGLISRAECSGRLDKTLRTLLTMRHHEPSGMYYNWYDEATGEPLTTWPTDGNTIYPFLSSVDNGWLAAGSDGGPGTPTARHPSWRNRSSERMNFKAFYNPDARTPTCRSACCAAASGTAPLHRPIPDSRRPSRATTSASGRTSGTPISTTTPRCPRPASRPTSPSRADRSRPNHYFSTWRTFPDVNCDWSWQEQRPIGETRNYLGVDVFEGAYTYRGMRIVPGWGGSMFEAMMPAMFVPEEKWAPRSWGVNHRLTVRAHREHGLDDAGYGYWGFSPASQPGGGYREYGVDAIGLNPDGYLSDVEKTNYDAGYGTCREAKNPNPTYGDGVVTPHALFLAMHVESREAYDNLRKLERELGAYGEGGFYDAIAVRSGTVAKRYLSLDQSMVMGSIGNVFGGDVIRRAFATGEVRRRIKPLIAMEQFGAGII